MSTRLGAWTGQDAMQGADAVVGVLDGPRVFPGVTPAPRGAAVRALQSRVSELAEQLQARRQAMGHS